MYKKIVSLFVLFFVLFSVSAVSVVSTEHFDIIYSQESEHSASLIYSSCEDVFREVLDFFGTAAVRLKPSFRIGVYINPDVQVLNAHYSSYTSNKIVLFDTPATVNGNLSCLGRGIVDVFEHELTHAVQFNLKSPLACFASDVFYDGLSWQYYNLTPMFVEGTAVLSESKGGSCRLNSPYVMQVVKEAKSEGRFPSFSSCCGAADGYGTGNLPYIFGGAFLEYLEKTYSSDKLCEFYEKNAFFHLNSSDNRLFEDVFGLDVDEAWKGFEESIEVPENLIEPEAVYSQKGNYGPLIYSGNGTFLFFDLNNYGISKIDNDGIKKIYEMFSSSAQLSVSQEGFVFASAVYDNFSRVLVLNEVGRVVHYFDNAKEAVKIPGGYCVFVTRTSKPALCIYNDDFELQDTVLLQEDAAYSDFRVLDGCVYALKMYKGRSSLVKFGNSFKEAFSVNMPNGTVLTSLNVCDDRLCFSWIDSSMAFTSYGEAKPAGSLLYWALSSSQIKGGVRYPVFYLDKIYFISSFSDGKMLSRVDRNEFSYVTGVWSFEPENYERFNSEIPAEAVKTWKKIQSMKNPIVIPLCIGFGYDSSFNGPGLTLMAEDATETLFAGFAFGYDSEKERERISGVVENSFNNLAVSASFHVGFPDFDAWEKTSVSYFKYINSPMNKLSVSGNWEFYLNEPGRYFNFYFTPDISFSSYRSDGFSTFNTAGIVCDLNASLNVRANFDGNVKSNVSGFGFRTTIYLPSVDSSIQKNFFAQNSVSCKTGYSQANHWYMQYDLKTVPFTCELGAVRQLGIYFNRFAVSALYSVTNSLTYDTWDDSFDIKAYFTGSPIVGMITGTDISLGADCRWTRKDGWSYTLYFDY